MNKTTMQKLLLTHEAMLALLLAITLVVLSFLSDSFLTTENLLNQVRLMAEVGLIALAMTLVIVAGEIDLSVASALGNTSGFTSASRESPMGFMARATPPMLPG